MNTTEVATRACKDYGVSQEAVKVAAISELLYSQEIGNSKSPRRTFEVLGSILDKNEMMSIVRWATWVQHAMANNLDGADIESLLELRRRKNGSKTVRRSEQDT